MAFCVVATMLTLTLEMTAFTFRFYKSINNATTQRAIYTFSWLLLDFDFDIIYRKCEWVDGELQYNMANFIMYLLRIYLIAFI